MEWMECDGMYVYVCVCVLGHGECNVVVSSGVLHMWTWWGVRIHFVYHDLDKWAAKRFEYDSNFGPCHVHCTHVKCTMRMQQLDISNFWHERNIWERQCSIKINSLRLAFHAARIKSLQSSKYTCNLIISRPNCSLSTLVLHSYSSHLTPTPILHNSFASA